MIAEGQALARLATAEQALEATVAEYNGLGRRIDEAEARHRQLMMQMQTQHNAAAAKLVQAQERVAVLREVLGDGASPAEAPQTPAEALPCPAEMPEAPEEMPVEALAERRRHR